MTDYSWCCNAFLLNPKADGRSCKRCVFCFTRKFFYIYVVCSSLLPFLYPELIYLIFLMQVGYVTTICFSCFLIRCVMVSPFFFKEKKWFLLWFVNWVWSYFIFRCASMHLIKLLTLMSWTIPFWILYITWWVCMFVYFFIVVLCFFYIPHFFS